jgi:hypothetical protein
MASVAVLLLFLGVASGSEGQSVARNSAAQTVVEKSLALGIDFGVRDVDAVHPARQDLASYSSAATWLTEQIQTADDTISQPPETFQVFLRDRDAALWIIVASLEKDQPEWNRDEDEQAAALLRPIMRLEKLLLATALYEERTGEPIQASRALEASWSLGRSLTGRLTIMDQLIAVAGRRPAQDEGAIAGVVGTPGRRRAMATHGRGDVHRDGPRSVGQPERVG